MLVPAPFLQETVRLVDDRARWRPAVDAYRTLTRDDQFEIVWPTEDDYRRGYAIFETTYELEFPDAVGLAYMRREEIEHVYSFDDGFEAVEDVTRYNTAYDPYAP